MKNLRKLLFIFPFLFPLFAISCGEDKEISPGHYRGPEGGTYTISSGGNKEYYGNNSGKLDGSMPTWAIILICAGIVIGLSLILISSFIHYASKGIYEDPAVGVYICQKYNCSNKFIKSQNRKYCDKHSSSKNSANVSNGKIKYMIGKENKMTEEIGRSPRLIRNTLNNQRHYGSCRGSFFAYLLTKEVRYEDRQFKILNESMTFEEIKKKYYKSFINDKYR